MENKMDVMHEYIKLGKVNNIIVEGEHDINAWYHGVNENTKLKYLIITFDVSKNLKRPLYIYNQHIEKVFYNESHKIFKIVLKE